MTPEPDGQQMPPAVEILIKWARALRAWVGRHPIVAAVLVLMLLVRAAVPSVLRRVIEAQANQAINGRVQIGDVDLSLLRGAVALQDVAIFRRDSDGTPIIAWDDVYLRIGWLGLFRKLVVLRELIIDAPRVHISRGRDGAVDLLGLVPAGPPSAPSPSPAAEPATPPTAGWSFAIDRLLLHRGDVGFHDAAVATPETVELEIDQLRVIDVALAPGTYAEPTRIELAAEVADAPLRLSATVAYVEKGVRVHATVDGERLPIRYARPYVPNTAWSELRGALDVSLDYQLETGVRDELRGRVAVRDFSVAVPGLEQPALRWDALAIEVDPVNLLARRVTVKTASLDDAVVVARPRAPVILPLLAEAAGKPADEPTPAAMPSTPSPPPMEATPTATPGATGAAEAEAASPTQPPPAAALSDQPPWQWSIDTAHVKQSHLLLLGPEPPLDLGVQASIEQLTSQGGEGAPFNLELRDGEARLTAKGTARLAPVGFAADLHWEGLSLPQLLSAVSGAGLLRAGATAGDLAVTAGMEPPAGDNTDAAPADTLRVRGHVDITGLSIAGDDPETFAAEWQAFGLDITDVRVPGALAAGGPAASGSPVVVRLGRVQLEQPALTLTRTADGLVLPSLSAPPAATPPTAPGDGSEASPPPTQARPSPASEPTAPETPLAVQLGIEALEVQDGQVTATDRSVKPFFRGQLSKIDVLANDVTWPELRIAKLVVKGASATGAPIKVNGAIAPTEIRLDVDGERLSLTQLNPYVTTYSPYSVARGTASFQSDIQVSKGYTTTNRVVLHRLKLKGKRGETVFRDQFGVPLSLALALMRDVNGDITLDVPVSGGSGGTQIRILTTVRNALQRAILNALTSPLKLLGAVTAGGGRVEDFQPKPVRFLDGQPVIAAEAKPQVQQIATLLAERPGLMVRLEGHTGSADRRWLQEQALLAQLRQGAGTKKDAKRAELEGTIQKYLEARASGGKATLPEAAQTALDEMLAHQEIPEDRLTALRNARVARLRDVLMQAHGIGAERIESAPPGKGPAPEDPVVTIGIDALS